MAWALSSSVWLVGSFSCGMQDFFFFSLVAACGIQFPDQGARSLIPWDHQGSPSPSYLLIQRLQLSSDFLCLFFSQPHLILSSRYCESDLQRNTYMAMLLPTKGFPVFPHSLLFPFLFSPFHPSYSPHPLSMSAQMLGELIKQIDFNGKITVISKINYYEFQHCGKKNSGT